MSAEVVKTPLPNQGEVTNLLRELAFGQIDEFVARQVYMGYKYEDPGLRMQEIHGKRPDEIAEVLQLEPDFVQKTLKAKKLLKKTL